MLSHDVRAYLRAGLLAVLTLLLFAGTSPRAQAQYGAALIEAPYTFNWSYTYDWGYDSYSSSGTYLADATTPSGGAAVSIDMWEEIVYNDAPWLYPTTSGSYTEDSTGYARFAISGPAEGTPYQVTVLVRHRWGGNHNLSGVAVGTNGDGSSAQAFVQTPFSSSFAQTSGNEGGAHEEDAGVQILPYGITLDADGHGELIVPLSLVANGSMIAGGVPEQGDVWAGADCIFFYSVNVVDVVR